MRRALTIITAVVALAVSAAPASASPQVASVSSASTTPPSGPVTGTVAPPSGNGIIMRDGGICKPEWGC